MSIAKIFKWNVICQVCRKKLKSNEVRKRWDGLLVCNEDYEEKHPRDMPIPPQREQAPIPFASPEPTDTFTTTLCTLNSRRAIPGIGTPGCMIPGFNDPGYDMPSGTFSGSPL